MLNNFETSLDLQRAIIAAMVNDDLTPSEADILLLSLGGEGWEGIRERIHYGSIESVMKAYRKAAAKLRKYMI